MLNGEVIAENYILHSSYSQLNQHTLAQKRILGLVVADTAQNNFKPINLSFTEDELLQRLR